MAQGLEEWWRSQGFLTRKMFLIIVGLTLTGSLGVIPPSAFLLDFTLVVKSLHVWRLATNLFFFGLVGGPGTFNLLIDVYLFTMYANRLEQDEFRGKPADFVWMLALTSLAMTAVGYVLAIRVLSFSLLFVLLWVWCRQNPSQPLSIMGLFSVKAPMFPWVLLALHWAFGRGPIPALVGILAGHLYLFLRDILPRTRNGLHLVRTPDFLKRYLPEQRLMGGFNVTVSGAGTGTRFDPGGNTAASQQSSAGSSSRHSWGQGRTLGRS